CENMEEMDKLTGLDIAFLAVNQPYTMTVEQAIDAINKMKPKIVYPYHFGDSDVSQIKEYFKDNKEIEVRIRDLK
ncbi:MAG: MBL fold metallo-hydrolase, partial [Spirochaetes bacterium]|nr:MBL fold metallo-hydrolase [Spirochaetota bacterium]